MKRLFLLITFATLPLILLRAQARPETIEHAFSDTWVFSVEGGGTYAYTDYKETKASLSIRGSIEYFFKATSNNIFGLKLNIANHDIGGTDNRALIQSKDSTRRYIPLEFKTSIFALGISVIYSYSINNAVFPYVSVGISNLWFNPKDGNGNTAVGNNAGLYEKLTKSYDLEGGIKILISDFVSLNANLGAHISLSDYLDDVAAGNSNDSYITAMFGVSYSPFVEVDNDDDGINNKFDACPEQPEDIDGFEDEDGCPDLDNDRDGIVDAQDKCPNEAEDFDRFQDEDGCPDPDNDMDGILDVYDTCPNHAEDKDGFNDNDGCPDYDNDSDGVPDSLDNCINEPETINGYKDEDGCPDTISTDIPDKFIFSADEIFNPNSAKIKFEAKDVLDEVMNVLKQNPETNWRIEGHSDSQGSERYIRSLSFERAKAVLEYFAAFGGLDRARFEVFGMGDKFPAGNNNDEEGRKKNRRIEIKQVK